MCRRGISFVRTERRTHANWMVGIGFGKDVFVITDEWTLNQSTFFENSYLPIV